MPSPLQSPLLRRIIAAYTINRLGTWFGVVALSLAVYDHTHSAIAVAALLIAAQVVPAFVVPAVVARAEASPRRGELSALYIFEGIVTAGLGVLLWHFSLPAVLVLAALDGAAALAASALLRAETARVARGLAVAQHAEDPAEDSLEDQVQAAEREANAALNVAFSVTFMLGPAIAGVVVASAGAPTALFIDAATFLMCGALLLDLRTDVAEAGEATVRARLRAAWTHIQSVPALRAMLLAEAVALVFFAAGAPIEVAYVKSTLRAGDRGYGVLLATWGVGVVLGSLVFARAVRWPLGAMLSAGTLGVGVAYVGFAAAPTLTVACLAALVGGLGNGVQWASLISAVQRLTPPPLHGRLMGAVESLGAVCPAVGLFLGGALVALSSPRTGFLVVGVGAIATTGAFLRLSLNGAQSQPGAEGESRRTGTAEKAA